MTNPSVRASTSTSQQACAISANISQQQPRLHGNTPHPQNETHVHKDPLMPVSEATHGQQQADNLRRGGQPAEIMHHREEIWAHPHDVYSLPPSHPYRPCTLYPSRTQKRVLEERANVSTRAIATTTGRKRISSLVNSYETRNVRVELSSRARHVSSLNLIQLVHNFDNLTCLLVREQRLTFLVEDIGVLRNLVILDAGRNLLSTLPQSICYLKKLKALILDSNQFQEPPESLFYLFCLRYLDLTENPLSKEWKNLLLDGSEARLQIFLSCITDKFTQKHPLPPPPRRQWKSVLSTALRPGGKPGIASARDLELTIMSYNILCPKYASYSQYPYCPSYAMDTQYRRTAIMNEIHHYAADVICLQELDMLQLREHYAQELVTKGYQHEFVTKNRGHFEPDPSALDGCAIFWRTSKFELVAKHEIRFNDISCMFEEWNRDRSSLNETMLNRLMPRDNTALVLFLRAKATQQYICITNGHLFWDPEYSDVKLMQTIIWTALLLKHLAHFYQDYMCPGKDGKPRSQVPQSASDERLFAERTTLTAATLQGKCNVQSVDDSVAASLSATVNSAATNSPEKRRRASFSAPSASSFDEAEVVGGNAASVIAGTSSISGPLMEEALKAIPVLICGDFNSLPESGVLQYLTRGHVNMQHEDFLSHSEGYALESWRLFKPLYYREEALLRHGLNLQSAYSTQEMKYTNYTYWFRGIIDYILFSQRHFTLEGYLCGVPELWFSESHHFYGCPNQYVPSDHFPLLVRLKLHVPPDIESTVEKSAEDRKTVQGHAS